MGDPLLSELSGAEAAEIGELLRGVMPEAVSEAVAEIERQIPEYTRIQAPEHLDFLRRTVERSVSGFLTLLLENAVLEEELLEFFRQVGMIEAEEGLTTEVSQAAFRIGAGVSIQRLAEVAERHPSVTPSMIAQVANHVFGYLGRVAEAVAQGHTDSRARAAGARRRLRNELIDLLVDPAPRPGDLSALADETGWRLPQTVAAVALARRRSPQRAGLALPPDVLVGLHLDEPCLIVPDPEGAGRNAALLHGLRDWDAAIGPTVGVARLPYSLRLARQTLALPRPDGRAATALMAVDHLPRVLLRQDPELADTLIEQYLAPLLRKDPDEDRTRRLCETLLASLEHGFNATNVAASLHLHPQTVRYRIRQLQTMFTADDLADPAHRLSLHLALEAWLTRPAR